MSGNIVGRRAGGRVRPGRSAEGASDTAGGGQGAPPLQEAGVGPGRARRRRQLVARQATFARFTSSRSALS